MLNRLAIAACIGLAGAADARANDSSAELATGGLVLTKSADVEMLSEDLYVSPKQIRVSYLFRNASDKDVTTLVAFPMPDIVVSGPDEQITVPTEDPQNLLGFSTKVDGKPAPMRVEQKVFAGGTDRTELLTRLGVPLAPHLQSTQAALDGLPLEAQDELKGLNMVEIEEYDAGKGMERHLSPRWTLKTTYFWDQTFPAKSDLAIEHEYSPSLGGAAQTLLGRDEKPGEDGDNSIREELASYDKKYCIDAPFLTAVRARRAAKSDYAPFAEERISYILKTGANWSRPIGTFKLVVDKGEAANLVSFCGDGVDKISPTRFEMKKTNFTPAADLDVLILVPHGR